MRRPLVIALLASSLLTAAPAAAASGSPSLTDPRLGLWESQDVMTLDMLVHSFGGTVRGRDTISLQPCVNGHGPALLQFDEQADGGLLGPARDENCAITGYVPLTFEVHDPGHPIQVCHGPDGGPPCDDNPAVVDDGPCEESQSLSDCVRPSSRATTAKLCDLEGHCSHWILYQFDAPLGRSIVQGVPSGRRCVHALHLQPTYTFHDGLSAISVSIDDRTVADRSGDDDITAPIHVAVPHGRFELRVGGRTFTNRTIHVVRRLRGC